MIILETANTVCMFCGTDSLEYLQDVKNKKIGDSFYGVIHCKNCHNIMFWYLKCAPKLSIVDGNLRWSMKESFTIKGQWDGPMTLFIWDQIEKAARLTRKPEMMYYVTVTPTNEGYIEHRLDFTEVISNWEKKVLDEIHHDSKEKVIICGKE